jgi:thioredoxin-like negative regulator of GroEL
MPPTDHHPEPTLIDLVRTLVEGESLPEAELERLQRAVAADPDGPALLAAYRQVHGLTGPLAEVPTCAVTFDRILPPRPRRRWLAAAAVLLVAGVAVVWLGLPDAEPPAITLAAIPLQPAAVAPRPAAVPELFATYGTEDAGGIAWLENPGMAAELARVTRRPLLVYLYHPSCPMCRSLSTTTLTEPLVVARAGDLVPVRINVLEASPDHARLAERGWPYLGVHGPDGSPRLAFPGIQTGAELLEHLDRALGETAGEPPLAWGAARAAATAMRRAVTGERDGQLGQAWHEYRSLARIDPEGWYGQIGREGVTRVEQRARAILEAARDAARTDPAPAAELLQSGSRVFAASPLGEELQAVRELLEQSGQFPRFN